MPNCATLHTYRTAYTLTIRSRKNCWIYLPHIRMLIQGQWASLKIGNLNHYGTNNRGHIILTSSFLVSIFCLYRVILSLAKDLFT